MISKASYGSRGLVYVAGPYAAPTPEGIEQNVRRAVAVGAYATRLGYAPIVPHAAGFAGVYGDPHEGDGPTGETRRRSIEIGCAHARFVSAQGGELWIIQRDDGTMSSGVQAEFDAWCETAHLHKRVASAPWAAWQARLEAVEQVTDLDPPVGVRITPAAQAARWEEILRVPSLDREAAARAFGFAWVPCGESRQPTERDLEYQFIRWKNGRINNCALANGANDADCAVCGGLCPDKFKF